MKNIRLTVAALFVMAIFAVSAFAQTAAQTSKIFVINTYAFSNEKEGITKFVTASKQLETEFKPKTTELDALATKLDALGKEITKLNEGRRLNPQGPISEESIRAKIEEYQRMEVDYKRKDEDLKDAVAKRSATLLDPIRTDIYKAMDEFAKKKGYPIILDFAQLVESKLVLAVGDESIDLTKEFITFYNTRPAASASATR